MPVIQNPRVTGLNSSSYLSPSQLVAKDKQPIYKKHFPKVGAYTLSSVAPNFSVGNGWMMCRFVCTTLPTAGASQYPMTIHGGSSANQMGFRLNSGASYGNAVSIIYNVASSGKAVENGQFEIAANEIKTAIFAWRDDGYQYLIVDDGYEDSTQTGARGWSATTLQIGGRNGGADALTGSVLYVEVGNTFLTMEDAAARLATVPKGVVIATAGQSNIQNWEDGVETSAPAGRSGLRGIISTYTAANCPAEVLQIHAAEGGSAIFKVVNTSEYWLEDDGSYGPELTQFFQSVDRTGFQPDFILWDQGESECHHIDNLSSAYYPQITRATYKAQLKRVFQHMRNRYPLAQILIQKLGVRTSAFTNPGGIQTIAEIQQELMDELDYVDFLSERFDLALYSDGTHYTDAAYTTQGQRAGRQIARRLGYSVSGGTLGPRLVSASRSGTSLTITIEHDGGTDFTPTTGIEGFKYIDGSGNNIALSSVVRASATTITATLASGVAGTLYYCYDNHAFVSLSNVVKDNGANALPLRRGKVAVA